MIEFKALCGHTLQARDEDAGRAVRCSQCGRTATVPIRLGREGLKFLMEEIEESAAVGAARAIRPSHSILTRLLNRFRSAKPGAFDPFALVLKLCYGLGLLILLYVVAVKMLPMWREDGASRSTANPVSTAGAASEPSAAATRSGRTRGLRGLERRLRGVFVAGVPASATAYCLQASGVSGAGPIWRNPNARGLRPDGTCPQTSEGPLILDVTLPWNDRMLSRYPGYWEFRRSVEAVTEAARGELLTNYFLPDEASDVFLDVTEDQTYIVRQFRVEARGDQLKAIRSLFLPRIARSVGPGFSLEPVVREFLPPGRAYGFDEEAVGNELAYYGVVESERALVMEALARVGAIPYTTPDGRVRVFKIGVNEGDFTTKLLE